VTAAVIFFKRIRLDRGGDFHYFHNRRRTGFINRLLKNAHLLRFPHPSPFNVPQSTPHGSGLVPLRSTILRIRGPCIRAFLNSLQRDLLNMLSMKQAGSCRNQSSVKEADHESRRIQRQRPREREHGHPVERGSG
jgi:hypothetical protein